jgi:hypothetical protein
MFLLESVTLICFSMYLSQIHPHTLQQRRKSEKAQAIMTSGDIAYLKGPQSSFCPGSVSQPARDLGLSGGTHFQMEGCALSGKAMAKRVWTLVCHPFFLSGTFGNLSLFPCFATSHGWDWVVLFYLLCWALGELSSLQIHILESRKFSWNVFFLGGG